MLKEVLSLFEQSPSRTVFIKNSSEISAKQFITDINSLANLWGNSLLNKQKIALAIDDVYFFCCAWIACNFLGKTTVMPPNNQQGTLNKLKTEYDIIIFDDDISFNTRSTKRFSIKNTDSIFFTSGSTREYKKYIKNTINLEKESFVLNKKINEFGLRKAQVYSTVSHQHLYGFSFFIIYPLLNKKIIHTTKLFIPENINRKLALDNVILITTPLIISHLRTRVDNIKNSLLISAASELKRDNASEFNEHYNIPILEIYGSTETGVIAYRQQLINSNWNAFKGVDILIRDNLLIVKSPFFKDPEQAMQDVVEIHPNNSFTLKGRIDRTVKIAGKRVSLSHMEEILIENPLIRDAACIKRESYREYIAVLVCLSENRKSILSHIQKQELVSKFKNYLKKYFSIETIPKQWRFINNIPTNTQGKHSLSVILKEFEA
ncbi:aconitate hydratase [Francisella halioticida]|uniref:Aconitate hydratase n=1 Tax=Francisella halioticida TaxID=549298 RepID=A0ABM6M1R2_9GAMM|nr:class I adenylate-forming enzyme family protein [Francisella halioticida]ASG68889.1 aconitate hydratase [Francisella halioticida]BCD91878.1 aconitate hydratase [Francisella halioticida]